MGTAGIRGATYRPDDFRQGRALGYKGRWRNGPYAYR